MEYSAFISYRRGNNHKEMEKIAKQFKDSLCTRLLFKDNNHKVYLDIDDKDRGIEKSLATKLCKSAFLIVLYHRPYCQYEEGQTPWCLKELTTFEEKAIIREQMLQKSGLNNVKMIIPILIDGETEQPSCFKNILPFKLDLTPIKPFSKNTNVKIIQDIVEYIHGNTDLILKSGLHNDNLFADCDSIDKLVDADHPSIVGLMEKFKPFERKPNKPKWS